MSKRAGQGWNNRVDDPIVVLGRTRVHNGESKSLSSSSGGTGVPTNRRRSCNGKIRTKKCLRFKPSVDCCEPLD